MFIKHLELFAGIGGFRRALELLCQDFGINVESVGFSEIDSYAIRSYKANFDTSGEVEMGDIVAFVRDHLNVINLEKFNLLSGGFPCQSFSMMGKQRGFRDMRGNVFFQIIEIMRVKKPKVVLLENVKNIITHNGGKTIEVVVEAIKEAGYPHVYYDIFNSRDFSIAQNRNRVYILALRDKPVGKFEFTNKVVLSSFDKIKKKTTLVKHRSTFEVLDKYVDEKYYLSEMIKPTILADGSKNFKSKSSIDPIVARPLTATMAKMHRACQDNYFSDDYIYHGSPEEYAQLVFTKEELTQKRIRRLTPKEAFILQGFCERFYRNAKDAGVSDSQLYKQAGNAVTVNTVYAILQYVLVEKKILEV